MRHLLVLTCVLAALWPRPIRAAERCELAVEPAATLLLPYFEVDLDDPEGMTTLLSINNAHSEPALANVTMWTDYGIPVLSFTVFLTGFDIATINLRAVFVDGVLPFTAPAAQDPGDSISPHGVHPAWDGDFEGCTGVMPFVSIPGQSPIHAGLRDLLRRRHSGLPDQNDVTLCHAENHGDGRVRGYLTVDNVRSCEALFTFPSEEGYFADRGTGLASNVNQLWGDFYIVHPARDYAQGDSLVHIQAFDGVGEDGAWQPGDQTFYGRYVGHDAIDNREPLPSTFGARYLGDFGGQGGTDLLVWRETLSADVEPVTCGEVPSWHPLLHRQIFDFDEQETGYEACAPCGICDPPPPIGDSACLPLATQRLGISGDQASGWDIGLHDSGWLFLDLNSAFDDVAQAWVVAMLSNSGRFSVGLPAVALHSSCDGLPDFQYY